MIIKATIIVLSSLLILTAFIPLIRNDYWVFRVFEFPRYQKWWICTALLIASVCYIFYFPDVWITRMLFLHFVVFIYLSYQIFPFTPFASRHIKSNKDPSRRPVRFVISNVYQYNRKSKKLVKEVSRYDVDVMVFVETDHWWKDQLKEAFEEEFPYTVLNPLENTYGMLFFSKHELSSTEVRYMVKDDIPSIRTIINHPEGQIKFFAIHPEPPVPGENLKSTERDKEILKVAKEAASEEMPVIVAGDLNDVAWSYTTERFVEVSGLKDPRRGRGMFSTFHANYPFFRWPLDHLFCSDHFELNRIRCLRRVGSDHLPIYVDLVMKKA